MESWVQWARSHTALDWPITCAIIIFCPVLNRRSHDSWWNGQLYFREHCNCNWKSVELGSVRLYVLDLPISGQCRIVWIVSSGWLKTGRSPCAHISRTGRSTFFQRIRIALWMKKNRFKFFSFAITCHGENYRSINVETKSDQCVESITRMQKIVMIVRHRIPIKNRTT